MAERVQAFLEHAVVRAAAGGTPQALVPRMCDVRLSKHSLKAYGRDLVDSVRLMEAQGVDPLHVTADHVKLYKRALLEVGMSKVTVPRRPSVLRGTYRQLADKRLVAWETAQDITAIPAPPVQKTPHRR